MKYKNFLFFLLVILIGSIPLLDLLHPGFPLTHDGQDHIARIANFHLNLTEGNIIPRWAPLLNWGYGHPVLMFLYPFPSYFASLFHFLGFSLVDSVKLVFGVSFILSGLTMYVFAKELFNKYAGFVAAMLYMFVPYRFVDLYVRGAIGEHVAFIFPPLVFYFLYKISKENSPWNVTLGALSFAGLVLSHNAISLMFIPLFLLFIMYLLFQSKQKLWVLLQSGLILGFGFALSGFFWIPALLEGKYTLRDIVTENEYASRFETLSRLFYSPWSYGGTGSLSVQIGIVHWFFVFIQPFVLFFLYKKKKQSLLILGVSLFIIFWLAIFVMLRESLPLYEVLTILQKFQFPWRFLTITVFITSLLGGFTVFLVPKRFQIGVLLVLTTGLLIANRDYWDARDYLTYPESFYTSVYAGTTDTGESSPIWSVRFMEERPEDNADVIAGSAQIKKIDRGATVRAYEIIAEEESRIRENTLYFPGWNVFINGQQTNIEFQDQRNRGLITYTVPEGTHNVLIEFTNTKLRQASEIVSVLGAGGVIGYIFLFKKITVWKRFR